LAQASNGRSAHLTLTGQDLALPGVPGVLHSLSLQAQGPWARLPVKISADGTVPVAWRFAGSGVLNQGAGARELELSGAGRVRRIDFKTVQPAVLKLTTAARDLQLSLSVGGGRAEVMAHVASAGGVDQISAKANLKGVALATLDPDLAGALSGDVSVQGRGSALGGVMTVALTGARSRDAPVSLALDGQVRADLSADRLTFAASATNAEGLKSTLDLALSASAATQPFHLAIDRTKPMQGAFSADGELRPLWDLFIGGGQTLSGRVATHAVVSGTLDKPKLVGVATLASGRFQDIGSGMVLQNFALNADFGVDTINVRQASGVDGHGGTVSGVGDISLRPDGGSTFALKLNKFRLFDNDIGKASVSGAVTVNRAADGHAKLTGSLKVDRADIVANTLTPNGVVALDVVEINQPAGEGEETAAAPRPSTAPPVALDVTIKAPRGVFVKGKGLNVELSLESHVGGTVNAPELTGVANLVLGSYDFAGKRFDFDQRGSIHLGSSPEDIRLDLSATLQEPTLTAVVRVSGTAAKPEIKLSSTPVLPQDEVLSEVLFGSSTAQLGPAQAAELASALASLAGGGGFDVLGRLRQFAGLDRLALGAGTTGTGVAGGKYINDNVYVELIGGGREGPAASVEWRVRKNFSIVSQVGAQGDAQLSVQFRKNY
jgi:translocation and assembly module TamB